MAESLRKRSPSAPAMSLEEALDRAIKVYEREQRHPAPTDVVAQDIGYKNASNGAALSAIAALRSYGLLERMGPGKLAVAEDVQSFHYAPDESLKQELLIRWLRSPAVFSFLLDKYEGSLPSDSTIRFDLIQEGFKPGSAESVLKSFKKSVEFANYYQNKKEHREDVAPEADSSDGSATQPHSNIGSKLITPKEGVIQSTSDVDRIPVRLDSKRRAWLEIPTPFYEADKLRLKAQIDLLITDEEKNEM
jgi:hypothetical protein